MPTITEGPSRTGGSHARARRRDATENRAALVEAAVRVLSRDIDGSLETIAAEAGLTRRAVYGHFATRDDLVREVLIQGAARIGSSILPIEHADARIEIALYGATLWREVQHASVTAEFAVRGPHVKLVAEALGPARAKLRATVRRGVHDGALRRDVAPDRLARLIEGVALDVLAEATHDGLDARSGHTLVMVTALSVAGLSWREADELVSTTPDLAFRAAEATSPTPTARPTVAAATNTETAAMAATAVARAAMATRGAATAAAGTARRLTTDTSAASTTASKATTVTDTDATAAASTAAAAAASPGTSAATTRAAAPTTAAPTAAAPTAAAPTAPSTAASQQTSVDNEEEPRDMTTEEPIR